MMKFLGGRIREASTMGGLALMGLAVERLASGDYLTGGVTLAFGLLAALMKEKGWLQAAPAAVVLAVALMLAGCETVSQTTGTSFAERCVYYRTMLAAAKAMPQTPDRAARVAVYEALLEPCNDPGAVDGQGTGGATSD